MKLTLKNVGCLSEDVIEPGELTVFCGANNTGKTYAMYVLWSVIRRRFKNIFQFAVQLASKLKEERVITLSIDNMLNQHINDIELAIGKAATGYLPYLFSTSEKMFANANIEIFIDRESSRQRLTINEIKISEPAIDARSEKNSDILTITLTVQQAPQELVAEIISTMIFEWLLGENNNSPFLLPAERGGLNMFYPQLDTTIALKIDIVRRLKPDNMEDLLNGIIRVQYAEPIQDYLNFLRKLPRLEKGETEFHDIAEGLQQDITQVSYHIADDGTITIKPLGSKVDLGIHLTSSTVKNFFGLWAYLETIAKSGDCLMIDEPELNLHPDNQRRIARLLVRLVNRGIKVVISTHSDYIVREINNMIMLGNDFPGRSDMEKTWGYDLAGEERLRVEQVAAYHFEEKQVLKIPISPEYGMEVTSMDNAINRMNQSNSDIYFALQDTLHPVITPEFIAE
ncbi:MAG: AAA family ATPase [Proteobacteria bacterium]|nr:AAA family ATPase [Pseudomonadota bacterium]